MRLRSALPLALMQAITVVVAGKKLDVIDLPIGFLPEGITLGREWTAYVGSFFGGRIWQGDLSTGVGKVVIEDVNATAMGMTFDRRNDYLWVCGGFAGSVKIYDTANYFSLVAKIQLAADGATTFVNDVILTDTHAYITESSQPHFYKITLEKKTGTLENGPSTVAETIPLGADFTFTPGEIFADGALNSNGIVVTDDEKSLIIVNELSGELFKVDPVTGEAALIDLGGALIKGGDGLVLRKNTLWVCQNRFLGDPTQGIVEVILSEDLSCGTVTRLLVNDNFNDPATALRKGNSLWTTVSKFATPFDVVPETEYQIVRADRDSAGSDCSAL